MRIAHNVSIWGTYLNFYIFFAFSLLFGPAGFAAVEGEVRADAFGFISEEFQNSTSTQFSLVGVSLKSVRAENDFLKINVLGAYAIGQPQLSYLNVKELFSNLKLENNFALILGRRLVNWSAVDSEWNLGFFQPQLRWNPINPSSQGLTGLFWQKREKNWGFIFFGSPLFVPDQGASYEIKRGKFIKSNPWFRTPPQNVKFYGQYLPIEYDIDTPPVSDIVYQASYGAQLEFGDGTGWFSKMSSQYHPSHQLALGYQASVIADLTINVEVIPKTYYENNLNVDVGFRTDGQFSNHTFLFSALENRPDSVDFEDSFTKPILQRSQVLSPSYEYQRNSASNEFSIKLSGLYKLGEDIVDSGEDASVDRASLTWKYLFKDAVKLRSNIKFKLTKSLDVDSTLSWTQSLNLKAKSLDFGQVFTFRNGWKALYQIILVDKNDENDPGYSNRDLDQFWLGAAYDF